MPGEAEDLSRGTRLTRRPNEGTPMKKLIAGLTVVVATAAIVVPLATAGGSNSDNAKQCQRGGWQNLVRQDGTGFAHQDECVAYGAHGGVLSPKPIVPSGAIAVSTPMFNLATATSSVTV